MNLKIINPKNLKREISLYGYEFSEKKYSLAMLTTAVASVLLGKLMYLDLKYILVIAVFSLLAAPFCIYNFYKVMFEQKRFSDATKYMETVTYSFMKHKLILPALQDTEKIFEDGMMHDALKKAIEHIEKGQYKNNLYKEAFEYIEKDFNNERIKSINDFMLSVQSKGGDVKNIGELYLIDKTEWEYNVGVLQQTKKDILNSIYIGCVAVVLFCFSFLYLETYLPSEMNIAKAPITQITSTGMILLLLIVVMFASKKMTTNWLEFDLVIDDKTALKEYEYVKNFDEKKEKRESYIWAAPCFIICIVMLCLRHFILCAGFFIGGCFMLNQHMLNYKIAKKNLVKYVNVAFSKWVTEITLLIQTDIVQVAIQDSYNTAAPVLKPELERVMQAIKNDPSNLKSYTCFFDFLDLEDIRTTMQVLYAMSETGAADAKIQLTNLQRVSMKLKNAAEKIKNDEIVTDMELIKNAPIVICCVVQFIDLAIFMWMGLAPISSLAL